MKIKNKNLFALGISVTMMLASCSDSFLEDKRNYDNVTPDVYNYIEGANGRLNQLYGWNLPNSNSSANYRFNCTGLRDAQSQSTEEYGGFSVFVDPENPLNAISGSSCVPDYFMGDASNIQASVYGFIREINDVIEGVEGCTLSQENKDMILGQALFFRAWRYYQLVKWYGGVPLVKEVQDPVSTSVTPRSSAKECIEFICEDLDRSAELLKAATGNGGWASSNDYGRITSGTSLALKARVLNLWASPLFNRANDETRWIEAYSQMKEDLNVINACGYGLYNDGNNLNGSTFARIFTQVKSPENVFVTIRSSKDPDDNGYYNDWETSIRPKNAVGKGNIGAPSAMLIDIFPMKDGKIPASTGNYTKLSTSDIAYDSKYPFMNRDPRFYRTFTFPGQVWAYNGDATQKNPNNPSYNSGQKYELWSYCWYTDLNDAGDVEKGSSYAADNLLTSNQSVYIRKRSDDFGLGGSPMYVYNPLAEDKAGAFRYSGAPYVELRYAEVLLNFAEAACMAGHMDEAVEQLKKIRERAGYTAENNYGLQADLASDKAACMSAILYERQIEFAYEGKRFDDCRRWLLYDGGANFASIPGAPSSWALTGWGGNTCTWLGFKPLNGQRREGIEYRTADKFGVGTTVYDSDPILKAGETRCAAVDVNKDNLEEQLETLKQWYETHLVYKVKKQDGRSQQATGNIDLYITFLPKYYFLGFTQGAMNQNVNLPQTIGWENTNQGGANGTFDPLAE